MNLKHRYTIDDLLAGCKRGERKAQELLYRALASKMYAVCLRYATTDFEAEDMLQTGFVKVFQRIQDFKGEGSFEGWVRRIMVNTAIGIYRKKLRGLNIQSIDEGTDQPQQLFDMERLEVEDLMRLIQKLPDGYRVVFNLYAIEGYSHKEIAELLGVSEGASKSQLSRARSWLKQKLMILEGGNQNGTYGG